MAESQPLSAAPEGAEYLRAVLRAPVYEAVQKTPLQKMDKLSSRLDNVILVKREDRQPVHSFKLRGAYAMMSGLTAEQKSNGVITASAGNHAQGVAFSASRLGVKALIVMPVATADIKVDAVRGFGGEVLLHGANFDEAKPARLSWRSSRGLPGCRRSITRWSSPVRERWRWSCCSRMPTLTAYSSGWRRRSGGRRGGAYQAADAAD